MESFSTKIGLSIFSVIGASSLCEELPGLQAQCVEQDRKKWIDEH
jgi:hypothetical protein